MVIRRALPCSLLLALVLLLGQWLAVAHAFEHPALVQDAACQLCVHAQSHAGALLKAAPSSPALPGTTEAPVASCISAPQQTAPTAYDIRGPPAQA